MNKFNEYATLATLRGFFSELLKSNFSLSHEGFYPKSIATLATLAQRLPK